ncbi:alpha/beta fold hydrolase [Streptococcus ferus]|uniref:alpha/beta fold hydrolase n=1 Tax=Streptococcus ferus TaxID=1345 RepID=UPI0035A0A926
MRLIFLHGLGQDKTAWDDVIAALPHQDCLTLDLFADGKMPENFETLTEQVAGSLQEIEEDFILIGLSLGGVLALALSQYHFVHLKGLIISGAQYRLKGNFLYKLQLFVFQLLPQSVFKKRGVAKRPLLACLKSMSNLDLSERLKCIQLPTLILCGQKDKPNLLPAKEIAELIPNAKLAVIKKGGHLLNTEMPTVFATEITDFLKTLTEREVKYADSSNKGGRVSSPARLSLSSHICTRRD